MYPLTLEGLDQRHEGADALRQRLHIVNVVPNYGSTVD